MCDGTIEESARLLAKNLFLLREPWRDRFLSLIAQWARPNKRSELQPQHWKEEEVVMWLRNDLSLHRSVAILLNEWQQPYCRYKEVAGRERQKT